MSLDAEYLIIPTAAICQFEKLPAAQWSHERNDLLAQQNSFKPEFNYSGNVALVVEQFLEDEAVLNIRAKAHPTWSPLMSEDGGCDSIVLCQPESHSLQSQLNETSIHREEIEQFVRRVGRTDEHGRTESSREFATAMLDTMTYLETWLGSIKKDQVGIRSFYY